MVNVILLNSLADLKNISFKKKLALSIGNFDGLHLGHKKLIKNLVKVSKKKDLEASILSFHPHPAEVFAGKNVSFYISNLDEKIRELEVLGVENFFIIKFDIGFSKRSYLDFLNDYIANFNLGYLSVGENFLFGFNREGNVEKLQEFCSKNKIEFEAFKIVKKERKKISSSRLREFLAEGKVVDFFKHKDEYYNISGKVVEGDKRGREIGFRTINVEFLKRKIVPMFGVYLVIVKIFGKKLWGVANVGLRPTFDKNDVSLEVHILDFDLDVYGEEVVVEFVDFVRTEKKFKSVVSLKKQIKKDVDFCLKKIKERK